MDYLWGLIFIYGGLALVVGIAVVYMALAVIRFVRRVVNDSR